MLSRSFKLPVKDAPKPKFGNFGPYEQTHFDSHSNWQLQWAMMGPSQGPIDSESWALPAISADTPRPVLHQRPRRTPSLQICNGTPGAQKMLRAPGVHQELNTPMSPTNGGCKKHDQHHVAWGMCYPDWPQARNNLEMQLE